MIRVIAGSIIFEMAALAINGSPGKLLTSLAKVAGVAINHGMQPHEREASLRVLPQNVLSVAPVNGRMALGARDTELISVNIGMTIGAGGADAGKGQIFVAVFTGGVGMRAGQGKSGLIMIEFRWFF